MNPQSPAVVVFAILASFCLSWENAIAQWSTDPTVNTTVSSPSGDQSSPRIAADGAGGAIIVWTDSRTGTADIYAQRIDASGNAQWTADGVAICTANNIQGFPAIISDGLGGAIMTWQDRRDGSYHIYAQRINASGTVQWTADGVNVCNNISELMPTLTTDGSGGAILTWNDTRIGIFAQRVNASGTVKWTTDGVQVCAVGASYDRLPVVVSDGVGGAILTWQDFRSGTTNDIYAQRVDSNGTARWTTDGVALCTAATSQSNCVITSDGTGGAIVGWQDGRSGASTDIYAQRIDSTGAVLWISDGVAICTATDEQLYQAIVGDNAGGAYLAWRDHRSGIRLDIYAQHVNGSGVAQWAANGISTSSAGGDKYAPSIVGDGSGGAIIAWDDWRNITYGIYAQHYDAAGTAQWTANGVMITVDREAPSMTANGSGGAIISWNRYVSNYNIIAQMIASNSTLPVELVSFSLRPEETSVIITWATATEVNSYGFEIERRVLGNGISNEVDQSAIAAWTNVGFIPASGSSNMMREYSLIDRNLASARYAYRLKQVDRDGSFRFTGSMEIEVGIAPLELSLGQNYPNPFNPTTSIEFSLPADGRTTLTVFDVLGREVARLVDGELKGGILHRVTFDASGFSSGLYFLQLEFNGLRISRE